MSLEFDNVFGEDIKGENNNGNIEKLVVTIDKGDKTYTGNEQRYAMKFFDSERDVLNYVSNISNGDVKVHKIFVLNHLGITYEKTISFINGQLDLINPPMKEGNK
jgi:hypothetical protein